MKLLSALKRTPAAAAVPLLFLALARPAAAQEPPPGFEAGIFEITIVGFDAVIATTMVNELGVVLIPVRTVAALAGLPFRAMPDAGLFAVQWPQQAEGVLDIGRQEIRLPAESFPLEPLTAVVVRGEPYLAAAPLGRLLGGADVRVDFGALTIRVDRDPPFPAQQRRELERRRERLAAWAAAADDTLLGAVPFVPRWGAGVVDWAVSMPSLARPDDFSLALGGGAGLWGGALHVHRSLNVRDGTPTWGDETAIGYYRAFPGGRIVRQLQIGTVAGGIQGRSFRGVQITNARRGFYTDFATMELDPRLPPGWEYEVYDQGRLLAFSEAGEHQPLPIRLRYGQNAVEVRMYGPAGEEVVVRHTYQVPMTHLPPGTFEYATGAGRCTSGQGCTYHGFGDARLGVASWLTLGTGNSVSRDTLGVTRLHARGELALASLTGWVATAQYQPDRSSRARVGYSGPGPLWFSVAASRTLPDERGAVISPVAGGRRDADLSLGFRGRNGGPLRGVRVRLRAEAPLDGEPDRWVAGLARDHRRGIAELTYEENQFSTRPIVALNGTYAVLNPRARLRGQGWFGRLTLDGAAPRQIDIGSSFELPPLGFLTIGAGWNTRTGRPTFAIGGSTRLPGARVSYRAQRSAHHWNASLGAQGSLAFGGLAAPRTRTFSATGTGGVHGRVFYDMDGDGHFGPGDRPAADVPILAGNVLTRTDEAGRYQAWGLGAYDVAAIRVDTVHIADPSWMPAVREVLLRPTPHVTSRVDFPLLPTREVEGRLVPGEDVFTAGGVGVVARNVATGVETAITTFSDGNYYFARLPAGEYELRVAATSLEALGATTDPSTLRFTVEPLGRRIIRVPPILLVRTPAEP